MTGLRKSKRATKLPTKDTSSMTKAHIQQVTNRYQISYPDHAPRATDPHYKAFNVYRAKNVDKAVCFVGKHIGFDQCADALGKPIPVQPSQHGHGLELHHKTIEFSLLNSVDIKALEQDFPFLTDSSKIDAWAESEQNLEFACAKHHRGTGGIHHAAYADFEASLYIRNLIT